MLLSSTIPGHVFMTKSMIGLLHLFSFQYVTSYHKIFVFVKTDWKIEVEAHYEG